MQILCTTEDVSRSEVQYISESCLTSVSHESVSHFLPLLTTTADVLYNRSLNLLSDAELVGCRAMGVKYDPADPNAVWLTGMDFTKWITGDICADGYMVMYEFPGGKLPAGMGFRFGQGTGINFLSLCVHYHTHSADIFAGDGQGVTGESRLRVVTVAESPLARSGIKAAGVLSVYKKEGLLVPATSGTSLMYNYMIPDPIVMHTVGIAFHSHQHTSAVEIWATREDGQRTVLLSASFQSWIKYDGVTFDSDFPIIRQGDRLWIHCHYNLTEVTHIGLVFDA